MSNITNYSDSLCSNEEACQPKRLYSLALTINAIKQIMTLNTVDHDLTKVIGASLSLASTMSFNAPIFGEI